MAKLHTRHTIALQAQRSRIHTTFFTQASFPRHQGCPRGSTITKMLRNFPVGLFFLQMCKCAFCKLFLSKAENVFLQIGKCEKEEMIEMCWEVSSWSVYSERAAAFYSGIRVQALETRDSFAPLLLCSFALLPLFISVQRLGNQPLFSPLFSWISGLFCPFTRMHGRSY